MSRRPAAIVESSRQGREEAYEFVGHDEDARSGLISGAKVAAFGRQSETCSSDDCG